MPARYRLDIRYTGTAFDGWQVQPGRRTVQGELARLLGRLGERARPTGAGRTDAGVHALRNVAHVDLERTWDVRELTSALNSLAPEDIAIVEGAAVDPGFHARYGARERVYVYAFAADADPFFAARRWTVRLPAAAWAAEALGALPEAGDYASFARSSAESRTTLCRGVRGTWHSRRGGALLRIAADRFLHGMVRTLAGTLATGARRREDASFLTPILARRDREAAGEAAPPGGLYLARVRYGEGPPVGIGTELDEVATLAGLGPAADGETGSGA